MTVVLDGLTIRYGSQLAVDGVSCTFPRGASGLLGRNGAGKSSILKALLGLVRPCGGRMAILGESLADGGVALRARIGYMPERDGHLPGTTGFEMVALLAMLSGMPKRAAWRAAHEALYRVGLEEQRYRQVSTYSAGMRQKAKLAAALAHDPDVLFLDEPTNGLDPAGREDMLALIAELGRVHGKSIVLSTHILQDVEAVCDAVIVLEAGRVVAAGDLATLTAGAERRFTFAVEPADLTLPGELDGGTRIEDHGVGAFSAWLPEGATPQALFAAVRDRGGAVRRLHGERRTLEDVFLGAVHDRARRDDTRGRA